MTCTDAARAPPTIAADRGNRASATTNFILICAIVLAVNRAVNHLVMLGNFLTPHATKRLVSEFCVRNYVVQTTKWRLTTRRGQSQADRATAARVGPSGQEHYKLHAIDDAPRHDE